MPRSPARGAGPSTRPTDPTVLKKAFRVTTAFGLFVAGYLAYVQAFALVNRGLVPQRSPWPRGAVAASKTARKAKSLAVKAVGPDHWASADDLPIRIYNSDRGF